MSRSRRTHHVALAIALISLALLARLAPSGARIGARFLYVDTFAVKADRLDGKRIEKDQIIVIQEKRWTWLPLANHRVRRVHENDFEPSSVRSVFEASSVDIQIDSGLLTFEREVSCRVLPVSD